MKKYYLPLICLFLLACTPMALAQFPGAAPSVKGKVSGRLLDAETGAAIPYATVILFAKQASPPKGAPASAPAADSLAAASPWKQVNGALSDEAGSFTIKDIAIGEYKVEIAFLGYDKKTLSFQTTGAKPDYDLGSVQLAVTAQLLEGVTVTGQKEVIEHHVDKLVFNAENDPSLAGGDATDVLRKTPMLAVDLDGNLSLRGNSNVRLLINGKPSTLFSGSVADALRSIPADEIKKVEVITVPTAKYDGEGSGGIVNIITKRKGMEGMKGTLNLNAGLRALGGGGSLTMGRGRFGLNGNLFGNYGLTRRSGNDLYRETWGENPQQLFQRGEGESRFDFLSGKIGAYYDFNAYTSVNSAVSLRNFSNTTTSLSNSRRFNTGSDTPFELISRNSFMDMSNTSFDWTNDFRRTYEGSEREIALAFQLSGNLSNTLNRFSEQGARTLANNNTNDSDNLEYTYQADYTEPFGKWGKLEIGAKAVVRRLTSDFAAFVGPGISEGLEIDPTQSDAFAYDQDVIGGYSSLNAKLNKKWSLITGLRYEHTRIGFDFRDRDLTADNAYGSFLPSAIASYTFTPMTSLKASYTRRIQRPNLYFLNPYIRQNSTLFISQGNPKLAPEITDQLELALNTMVKKNVVNLSLFYRSTQDVIESFQSLQRIEQDTVTLSSFLNVGTNQAFGANVFTNIKFTKWVSLFLSADASTYNVSSASLGLSNKGLVAGGNAGLNFNFGKGWKANTFTFYRSAQPTLQGRQPSYMFMNMGISKDILKEKGNIGLSAANPFSEFIEFRSEVRGENFYQSSAFRNQQRDIRLSFRYNFGDMKFRPQNRNTRIRNDDQKSGGSQGGEGN
ncbi:outer membrane beta-barrel family protein [Cesiribacter andamanensis]|uniref:Outer membrane receptor FepA n=1 Tax=Cesiribacter andamanensis AMV16 TaxID=1279009 RepID=M7N353_9BACT|nr:outer membrane beta-barrel family protein [Cesiribacter andamanensis]EMR03118.1 outer membrane receptor FepA [Cesiribacter andamanensis AMV16]